MKAPAIGSLYDPTANVTALVSAAERRQDDLRAAESRHVRELMNLHAAHQQQLDAKEASRLDAIRQVDQINVMAKAESTLTAVQTLASSQSAVIAGLNDRMAAVEKSIYEGKGRGGGVQALYGWILGALGAVGVLFTVAKAFIGR
jgi:hypothetical protein